MQCYRISTRRALVILLSFLINGVQHTQLNDNNMDSVEKSQSYKGNDRVFQTVTIASQVLQSSCSASKNDCHNFSDPCTNCSGSLNYNCIYGNTLAATCTSCKSNKSFQAEYICRYCYQTEHWEHECVQKVNCNSVAINRSQYTTNCTVKDHILCLGSRTFYKNVHCNWTGGYRWSTALILSITLGGFGADRFYLGHWQEGIGKLFSFGGLGVWTLIDVILISLHYLGPADGSLYI